MSPFDHYKLNIREMQKKKINKNKKKNKEKKLQNNTKDQTY